jgi:hypothetical protein
MKLIAYSGRKQSGKGILARFTQVLSENSGVPVLETQFAAPLKRFCVDVLGLNEAQVFGTDEDKNSIVPHLLWENLPIQELRRIRNDCGIVVAMRSGPMKAREVMQVVATEIFRAMYPGVWIDATMRLAQDYWAVEAEFGLVIISDCRFKDEVLRVQETGGIVVRLTRDPFADPHASESALDRNQFDWKNFDIVIDNDRLSISQTCMSAFSQLSSYGLFDNVSWGEASEVALQIEVEELM